MLKIVQLSLNDGLIKTSAASNPFSQNQKAPFWRILWPQITWNHGHIFICIPTSHPDWMQLWVELTEIRPSEKQVVADYICDALKFYSSLSLRAIMQEV